MLANITKSSSPRDSSMQLFKFSSTAASENCREQWLPLTPLEHPYPASKNCFTFPTHSSLSLVNNSEWSHSAILMVWDEKILRSYQDNSMLVVVLPYYYANVKHWVRMQILAHGKCCVTLLLSIISTNWRAQLSKLRVKITAVTTSTRPRRVFSVCLNLSFRGRQSTVWMVFHALWQRRFPHRMNTEWRAKTYKNDDSFLNYFP